ncbi:MAG: ATP-binding protein, partial [Planctomycetota bacterium]
TEIAVTTRARATTKPPPAAVKSPAPGELLNALPAGVLVVDADLRVRRRNERAAAWLGRGDDVASLFREARFLGRFEGWEHELDAIRRSGTTRRLECAVRTLDDGEVRVLHLHLAPLPAPRVKGADPSVVILVTDLGRQDAVDQRHEVVRRLTALGKLAARVAHELNNPLDGILRYVNLSLRIVGDAAEPKLKSYLDESRVGLMRMIHIIGDLLEFSRSTDGEFDEIGVNETIEQAIRATADRAQSAGIVVAVDFQSAQMPTTQGTRLYQVCCNLIQNAIDAMPRGGRLSIATGIVDDHVVIRVADTGPGLPEPLEKVFEPFYTTKPPGQGTGLGLAISKEFIEDMHGTIAGANDPNGGAVFGVRIPLSALESRRQRDPVNGPIHAPDDLSAKSDGREES